MGIISFELKTEGDFVVWKDIRFESDADEDTELRKIKSIESLKFDKAVYEVELEDYLHKYCT